MPVCQVAPGRERSFGSTVFVVYIGIAAPGDLVLHVASITGNAGSQALMLRERLFLFYAAVYRH